MRAKRGDGRALRRIYEKNGRDLLTMAAALVALESRARVGALRHGLSVL